MSTASHEIPGELAPACLAFEEQNCCGAELPRLGKDTKVYTVGNLMFSFLNNTFEAD